MTTHAKNKIKIFLTLHNIRSLYNIGSIFRTADAAGVEKIFLTGYTAAPIDIFGKDRKEISKTALGAEKNVKWEKEKNISNLIKKIKNEKIIVVALEQNELAVNYKKFRPAKNLMLILGNEVNGIPKKILNQCDKIIEIPMAGKKESLNVSVATGIALFNLKDGI